MIVLLLNGISGTAHLVQAPMGVSGSTAFLWGSPGMGAAPSANCGKRLLLIGTGTVSRQDPSEFHLDHLLIGHTSDLRRSEFS